MVHGVPLFGMEANVPGIAVVTGGTAGVGRATVRELARRGYDVGILARGEDRLRAAVNLHRTRARTLKDVAELVLPYFRDEIAYDPAAAAKFLKDPDLPGHLEALRDRYARVPEFTKEALEATLRALADERQIKAGVLIHPTRMALSGAAAGPPLFDLVEVMGRDATLARFDRFATFLREGAQGEAVGNTAQAAQS